MNIRLMPRVEDIVQKNIAKSNAIVIDMLRATSVITTALYNGARGVIPVLTVDEAMAAKAKYNDVVLGGERRGLKINGFDLGNSPLEYTSSNIKDKTIIMTTSNGTRAIKGCESANHIYIGSMLNGKSVAARASLDDADISIVCAGTLGKFSLDDFICAGYIIDELMKVKSYVLDDISFAAHYMYDANKKDVEGIIKNASHYNYLVSIGLEGDIKYCCRMGILDIVPEYKDGIISNPF